MNILIVEDHPDSAELLKAALTDTRYHVDLATNTFKATQMALTRCPDLIICDWQLGEPKTGIELCQELKKFCPKTQFIFVSAGHLPDIKRMSVALSPVSIIAKPVDLDKLEQLVGTLHDSTCAAA